MPTRSSCDAGSACVGVSTVFFALQTATIKFIDVPPILLLQVRASVLWALVLTLTITLRRLRIISPDVLISHALLGPPDERMWLLLRALCHVTGVLLYWTALECLPVGDATALVQSFLFTNFRARAILKEPLPRHVGPCSLLHVCGVALIARPHFLFAPGSAYLGDSAHVQQRTEGAIAAVVSAILFSAMPIFTRLARRSHWLAIEHANNAFCAFVAAPSLLAVFLLIEPRLEPHPDQDAIHSKIRRDLGVGVPPCLHTYIRIVRSRSRLLDAGSHLIQLAR